jgi:hypothetical protein
LTPSPENFSPYPEKINRELCDPARSHAFNGQRSHGHCHKRSITACGHAMLLLEVGNEELETSFSHKKRKAARRAA